MNLDKWADRIDGQWLDLDAAPAGAPYQCHDVWLSYLYELGGKPGDGYAPGTGYTDQVWRQFPVTARTGRLFTKHGPGTIKRGDVVFWSAYDGNGLPHVAVALADAEPGRVYCLTQNPGRVRREYLTRRGVLGVLRPIPPKSDQPVAKPTQLPEVSTMHIYVRRTPQHSVYAYDPLTGRSRKIETAEWNTIQKAHARAGIGVPVVEVGPDMLKSLVGKTE